VDARLEVLASDSGSTVGGGVVRRVLVLSAVVLAAAAAGAVAAEQKAPSVIVLSWDGTRFDYLDRAELPALSRIAREGTRAERLVPVFPSSTFPNHVSLATGTYPDRHGIVGNRFLDDERGRYSYEADASWIDAEPIWMTAERQGVRAATFFWVGSETDWNGAGASYRRAPFDSDVPETAKVDQILAWLDLPEAERPRLVMSWWHGPDSAGHRHGPESSDVTEQLVAQDVELARLLAGLDERNAWPHTTLILVSDHGMALVNERIDVAGALAEQGIEADPILAGGYGFVHLADPGRRAEALKALNALPGVTAHASDALPDGLRATRPDRSGDIVLVAEPPRGLFTSRDWTFFVVRGAFDGTFGASIGVHGFLPGREDMHGVFLAMGRGVASDLALGPVRAIDVAPTVSHLLGIEPPLHNEGKPIEGLGPPDN
jgi:predicted AlkP superfamily pyrophosphatase or phosphodiesterase